MIHRVNLNDQSEDNLRAIMKDEGSEETFEDGASFGSEDENLNLDLDSNSSEFLNYELPPF